MTTTAYDLGDVVRMTATFTDPATNAAVSVSATVTCTVRDPNGTTYTPSVTNTGTGTYRADLQLLTTYPDGRWFYRFATDSGGGGNQAAAEADFRVRASSVLS